MRAARRGHSPALHGTVDRTLSRLDAMPGKAHARRRQQR